MDMMSEKHPEWPRWLDLRPIGLIAMAGALVWSTSIGFGTWKSVRVKPEQRTLRVTGSAKKRIVSDLIQWEAVLEAHAPDRTAAYKQLHEEADKAVEFLKAQGVKPEEIRPQSASFQEEFDTQEEIKVLPGHERPDRDREEDLQGLRHARGDRGPVDRRRAHREGVARDHVAARAGRVDHVEAAAVLLHAARRAQGRDARRGRQGRARRAPTTSSSRRAARRSAS